MRHEHETADGEDGEQFICSPAGKAWLQYMLNEDDHDLAGARLAVDAARAATPKWFKTTKAQIEANNAKGAAKRLAVRERMAALGLGRATRVNAEALPTLKQSATYRAKGAAA